MYWKLANPDRLFDRTWRPRHPLRPRLSAVRRWCMLGMLTFLATIILGYAWLTDARRVRMMAGAYLSELLGSDVEIGRASLSIFEGLRLDDVRVFVDGGDRPDAMIFHAQSLKVRYNPGDLLTGKVTATEIVAINPTVVLVEDKQTHRWNYQRLWHGAGVPPRHLNGATSRPTVLPQIILRDAQVAYQELNSNRTQTLGWYSLEGRLSPGEEPDAYDFELQSRGRESLGPSVKGTIRTDGGVSVARGWNLPLGPDIKAMLMAEPRAWCERHQLQGRIDMPEMLFSPGVGNQPPTFRVEIALSSVELAISPQEWMSRQQNHNVDLFHTFLDSSTARQWMSDEFIAGLRRLSTPEPVHMRQVSGTVVFTEKGLELKGVNGRLENNWFNVDGKIDGYSEDAPATITLASLPGHDFEIPPWSPTYAGSLPPEVQEIYERLHPQGTCGVSVTVDRKEVGARFKIVGQVDIHDGQFRFSDFPYLLSGATGAIMIGHDSIMNMDGIRIVNVHGHGLAGGPNADSIVSIDGFVGPLDQVAGVWLDVRANNLCSEPAIRAALPVTVDRALRLFDPTGAGDLPSFRGDILCHILRPVGSHKKWRIETDINLQDADGTLIFFPYPLKHLSGRLEVRDGYLNIIGLHAAKGDATVAIDGQVHWKTGRATTRPLGPELTIIAKHLPLDQDLKNALPAQARDWLTQAGAGGTLDLTGRVMPMQPDPDPTHKPRDEREVDYQFDGTLTNGSLWPHNGTSALAGMTGELHIKPDHVSLTNIIARHGPGNINANVDVTWAGDHGTLSVAGSATQLPLDDSIYAMLPPDAQDGWNNVKVQGDADASLRFQIPLGETGGPAPALSNFEMQLRPHELSITPSIFPYRLDHLTGLLTVTPNRVITSEMTGWHGKSKVAFIATGDLGPKPEWNLKLASDSLTVDNDFTAAAPDSVSQVIKALKLDGKIGLNVSQLSYRPGAKNSGPADLDFAAKITMLGSSVNVGVAATDIHGSMDVAGLVRHGAVHRLAVQLTADDLKFAGASAGNIKATLVKAGDDPTIRISHLQGQLAGGDISGDGEVSYTDSGPGRYDFALLLHDADVEQLSPTNDKTLRGRLTASLQMDGMLNDQSSRRGHGDVTIAGQDMYNVPVLLGLMQITNLALPLSSPFSEANTKYSIDGQIVTFDQMSLTSKDMSMSGSGEIDFGARHVSLWLVTDNAGLLNLPVVGPLIHGAKQELMKIHVSGTIQQPKVSATTFNTVTTTVDQVLSDGQK